ncbi:MAG: response regulator [Sphingobacteriia bacterium]|nr:MAG: response regulator [Sphingobacteriia bacterium]TAG30657.1 MAG: response regulator [Sphingobacteriia bacterium]TAH07185.1 MAG: response regulator [Sphingobacteriia bacterium]
MPDSSSLLLRILVIEDNPVDLLILEGLLWKTRLPIDKVFRADRNADAIAIIEKEEPSLILLDLTLADSTGLDSYNQINRYAGAIPVIVLTGLADMDMALETMANGAQDYLVKGEFDEKLLSKSIQYSIERKKNLENIRVSREQYSSLFYYNPMAIYVWDLATHKILEVNAMAEKEYGYTLEQFLKLTIWELRAPSHFGRLKKFIQKITESSEMKSGGTWEHITKSGKQVFMDISSHRLQYNGRNAVMAIANNITDKLLLESKLEEERQAKQKEITEAVIHTQEKERHDISKELHDNVNQQLTVAMMYIASAEKKHAGGSELLKQSAEFILHAIEEIRSLSKGLVTPLIKDFGLVKAIDSILDDLTAVKEMGIEFISDTFIEDDINYDFKLSIFRIIQEQVSNILKHSKAASLKIELGRNMQSIYLSINDNGIGFDLSSQKKGIGLYNITSRVELFNGSISIHTAPTSGCAMHISFPITKNLMR